MLRLFFVCVLIPRLHSPVGINYLFGYCFVSFCCFAGGISAIWISKTDSAHTIAATNGKSTFSLVTRLFVVYVCLIVFYKWICVWASWSRVRRTLLCCFANLSRIFCVFNVDSHHLFTVPLPKHPSKKYANCMLTTQMDRIPRTYLVKCISPFFSFISNSHDSRLPEFYFAAQKWTFTQQFMCTRTTWNMLCTSIEKKKREREETRKNGLRSDYEIQMVDCIWNEKSFYILRWMLNAHKHSHENNTEQHNTTENIQMNAKNNVK